MSSVLITSTMKSEPSRPCAAGSAFGVPVSAATVCALGGSADGSRAEAAPTVGVAPFATGGVAAVAAPATATPARNLRRFTSGRGSFRAMEFLPLNFVRGGALWRDRLTRTLMAGYYRRGRSVGRRLQGFVAGCSP